MTSRTSPTRSSMVSHLFRAGLWVGCVAIASAPAAAAAATSRGLTRPSTAGVAAKSAPFTIGLSARTVTGGSTVTVSGLANAKAGTPLTILSDALSSTRLIGGVPAVMTPALVEGTYRTSILVPPATKPGAYAVALRATGKQVAMTSIQVVARPVPPGGPPTSKPACAGISFTVLHNDQSGGVTLPAGAYRVISQNLNCATASEDFRQFLNKYNAAIPGWSATTSGPGHATFTQRATGDSFTISPTR